MTKQVPNGNAEIGRQVPVLSLRAMARFRAKYTPGHSDKCWQWTGPASTGRYGLFRIGDAKYLPHRIAWTLAFGRVPEGKCVCHTCDNPRCVNPAHLWLGSHADNMADKVSKDRCSRGHGLRGELSTSAKLTGSAVAKIRLDQRFQRVIAAEYGVDQSTISDIKRGKTWQTLS